MTILATLTALSMIVLTMMAAVKKDKKTAIIGVAICATGMTITGIGFEDLIIRTILNLIVIGSGLWLWVKYFR